MNQAEDENLAPISQAGEWICEGLGLGSLVVPLGEGLTCTRYLRPKEALQGEATSSPLASRR